MNIIEIFGAICSLICVWLNTQGKPQAWYWAILGGILYAWIFWETKLFGNFLVQVFFCAISVYGFWEWNLNKKAVNHIIEAHSIKYNTLPHNKYILLLCANIILFLILYFIFIYFLAIENNTITILDILSSVGSIIAQYLLAKRYLENWFFWIIVNILVIIITLSSFLYVTSFLYLIFLILAIYGYIAWKKEILANK